MPHALLEKSVLTQAERSILLEQFQASGADTPKALAELLSMMVGLIHHNRLGTTWVHAPNAPWDPTKRLGVLAIGANPARLLSHTPEAARRSGLTPCPEGLQAAKLIMPKNARSFEEGAVLDLCRIPSGRNWSLILLHPNPERNLAFPGLGLIPYASAKFGFGGDRTSIPEVEATLEFAIHHAQDAVGAILPRAFAHGPSYEVFAERFGHRVNLRYRLDLDAIPEEGIEDPVSLCVFTPHAHGATIGASASTFAKAKSAILKMTENTWDVASEPLGARTLRGRDYENLGDRIAENRTVLTDETELPLPLSPKVGAPEIRLALGGRAHKILLLPQGNGPARLLASLAVQEARLWHGYKSSEGFKPQSMLDWDCDLPRNAGHAMEALDRVVSRLGTLGVIVSIDNQLLRHLHKADAKAIVENTPHPQWIKSDTGWKVLNSERDPIAGRGNDLLAARGRTFSGRCWDIPDGLKVKQWDRTAKAHVEKAWPGFPLYAFARIDASRVLTRRSTIYSAKQGLGKSRFSVAAFLASGMSRGLWVLESRLINEFMRELKGLGLEGEAHLIDSPESLKDLGRINIVTYNRLWKEVGNPKPRAIFGLGGTYAAALAKRRLFVFMDESHRLKSPDAKQAQAARFLAQRAKRVVLMTGTAVQSYPRNIRGLLSAAWGDGTAQNPYGASLRRPLPTGYSTIRASRRNRGELVAGSSRFNDDFVDMVTYTPTNPDGTLGDKKSREMPRVKDFGLWRSFLAPKILRRVPSEPEVRASGFSVPSAEPQWVMVPPDPDHFAHYHRMLSRFADIWHERVEEERRTGATITTTASVLAELDILRFASTAPIVPHRWATASPELAYPSSRPTALMLEAAKRICRWVEEGERVVVGAEKPSALQWLSVVLANADKWVDDAEPVESILALDSDITKRNRAIDLARDENKAPVLMISVGTGKEGLNLPEFSKLITLDLGWTPGDLDQFRHRILRPGQMGDPEIVHLFHQGFVDEYMFQLCNAKADAIAEAVDGQDSSFDYSSWRDFRTFTLQMLAEEGYAFAVEALAKTPLPKIA